LAEAYGATPAADVAPLATATAAYGDVYASSASTFSFGALLALALAL
jgi:hypothetical protein